MIYSEVQKILANTPTKYPVFSLSVDKLMDIGNGIPVLLKKGDSIVCDPCSEPVSYIHINYEIEFNPFVSELEAFIGYKTKEEIISMKTKDIVITPVEK